jgi:RNA polymerase sigma factor (TIGR02999 family)
MMPGDNSSKHEGSQPAEAYLPLVYDELRQMAAAQMARQPPGQTLQATALVHEAFLRLSASEGDAGWRDRKHFFRAAAQAMRCILVDHARAKSRPKHGGRLKRVNLDGIDLAAETPPEILLLLDEALKRLSAEDPIKAKLVELRFFVGLSNAEAAEVLGISEPTVKRMWRFTRAWLFHEVRQSTGAILEPSED